VTPCRTEEHPRYRRARGSTIAGLDGIRAAASYFDTDYFGWQGDSAERSAQVVVPLVVERLRPKSVVDVGCGSGGWLKVFVEHGVTDVVGIDGPYVRREALRIEPTAFVAQDLAEPFELDRRFDLALSLEAAHYVSEEHAEGLVDSIAKLAPAVLFGAAVPHQGGGPGRNRQWPSWWAKLFAAHGFRAVDWLRPIVWEDDRVDWWYAQNTILFLADGGVGERILPLVHPGLAAELAHPTEAQVRRRRFGFRR
jgi:SAM-dependent methyltransferase